MMERIRGKKVELLSYQYDHVFKKTVKGFVNLVLGWTDAISFVPVLFNLHTSRKIENIISGERVDVDYRTCGGRARKDAHAKKTDMAIKMLKLALSAGIEANYVLMDSWFFSEKFINMVKKLGLSSIGMVKTNVKFRMMKDGPKLSQKKIFKSLKRQILGLDYYSCIAFAHGNTPVRLVFVRNYSNANETITLATDDLSLTAEQVIQLYSRRWLIETNFRAQKQYFGLNTECQAHDFDTINAFTAMSNIRYMVMELQKRCNQDPKSIGELFCEKQEMLHDIPFASALETLMEAFEELPDELDREGCIKDGCQEKTRQIVHRKLRKWYEGILLFIQDLLDLPQTTSPS